MSDIMPDKTSVPEQESHPIPPFLPSGARLLMCGTFPPSRRRWSMDFYYPNFINDMWRIFGIIYFNDRNAFVDAAHKRFKENELRSFLIRKGIALSDTGREIIRQAGNAADKHLKILRHIDLGATLGRLPECHNVATTGEKAAGVVAEITGTSIPKTGEYVDCRLEMPDGSIRCFRHWRMPSSSRAYPLKIEKKAEMYARMLRSIDAL